MDRDMLRQKNGVCGTYHKNPNMWEYMRKTRIPVDDIFELVDRENRGLDKTQALFADMSERKRAWEELARHEDLELVGSLRYNIEVNAAGVNKGTGLVNLGSRLGIKREEIMAFGDGDNDTVMLKEVGFGVAMANGEPQVKEAADYITLSNEEDGVAAKRLKDLFSEEEKQDVRSIKSNYIRYCGGNHGMAADQQHGASDLVGRITAFETKSGVS